MKNCLAEVKICIYLRPFLNGLSLFLGILFLGLMSCSSATVSTPSSPIEDKTPPTITISTNESLEIGKTGTITFTFSEKVTNFTPDDIQFLTNGANGVSIDKSNFVTNNLTSYSLEITPKIAGTLTVSVQDNSFEDLYGNQNTDSFSTNFSVEDKTPSTEKAPPTVIISTNESLEIGKTGAITFTFSEKVTNFTPDEIQLLMNGVTNSLGKDSFVTNGLTNYFLEITPKLAGTLTVSIPANSFYDLSGNQNTDSFSTNFSVEDKTPPTVTISTNESLEIGKTGTITFTFSEKVTNFTSDEIQLLVNGVNVGKDKFVTNGLTNYFLEITPKIAGTLTVSIPANSFYDLSGNQNTDSFSTNFSVEDKTPPTVTISTNESLEIGKTGTITFTFSEKVTNFTSDEIQLLVNGVNVGKDKFVTNGLTNYFLEITPKIAGTLTVSIPANSFYDLSGNQSTKNYTSNFEIDPTSYTIYFKLNGGSFISPQITTLKVVSNEAIEQTKLGGILSYPPIGPNANAVTRGIFEWRNNGTKYELSTPVSSDLTLEAVWSNSCGKVETFHPANRNDIKTYTDKAISDDATTNLNHIDTSAITDMNYLFYQKRSFKGEIGCWNTANVTNVYRIFKDAYAFNQNIGSWDVGNVTDMNGMFSSASVFNQDISSWDVGNVTDMNGMFSSASVFNQDISRWDVANVTDMSYMFNEAWSFNQDISNWDVGKVTNMSSMFKSATAFNQDISGWDVGNVTDMSSMFLAATAFNQDISGWDVGNVTDMRWMFSGTSAFNQDLSGWSVSNVNKHTDIFRASTMESRTSQHPRFSSP